MIPAAVVRAYIVVPALPNAYTLSKIFVGSRHGSVRLLACGSSQKKCALVAHIVPPSFLAFSTSALTCAEAGLDGADSGAWAIRKNAAASARPTLLNFIFDMSFVSNS